jgi:hypothetical protein
MVIYSPLPKTGDTVLIDKLVSAKNLNGRNGTVKRFHHDQGRYEIEIAGEIETKGIKLANLSVIGKRKRGNKRQYHKTHVLIPCHAEHPRRILTFLRCITSVAKQQYPDDFDVFIGLSGSDEFRAEALRAISLISSNCSHSHWHADDTGLPQRSQMEHFRYLLDNLSVRFDPRAMLMFLDSDDMFHPLRLQTFHQAKIDMQIPDDVPLPLPCKLLLSSEAVDPNLGRMEDLISGPTDFFKWQKSFSLRHSIQVVPTSLCDAMDCNEYFDYMIPTPILQKFFRLNPPGITSNKYCDLRLLAVLETLTRIEVADNPNIPWLIAHYKASLESKERAFDNHGVVVENVCGISQSVDQVSMDMGKPSQQDIELAAKYRKLSPSQVRMCRLHVESIMIQHIGWDAKKTTKARRCKCQELDRRHGMGFGTDLFKEVEAELWESLGENAAAQSKGAWKQLL